MCEIIGDVGEGVGTISSVWVVLSI